MHLWTSVIDLFLGDLCETEAKQIKCPTLIVHGDQDPIVDYSHAEKLHRLISNSK